MRLFLLLFIIPTVTLLSACEQYTEKTSPCFDRSGEPVVSRASIFFAATAIVAGESSKDCTFEALPRPQ